MRSNEAKTNFSMRAKMLPFKFNYKNDKKNQLEMWKCDSCMTEIETQSHIIHCPAYHQLREGKSLDSQEDLVGYFQSVMTIRERLNLIK